MKRILITAIAALLAFGQGASAQTTIEGLVYKDGYYEIADAAALNALANYVNGGKNCSGLTFKVTNDIAFGESDTFTPIGTGDEESGEPFSGTFDGGNFTISGIRCSEPEGVGIGLFGYIYYPAVIKNVKLENCSFAGNFEVGAIVGWNQGSSDRTAWVGISNCTVGSNVTVTAATATIEGENYPGAFAGGIIGACNYMTVKDCVSAAMVEGDELVGGITGRLLSRTAGEELGVVDNCYFTGKRTEGSSSSKDAIGKRGPSDYDTEGGTNGLVRITLFADDSSQEIRNAARMDNYSPQTCDVTIHGMTLKKDGKWHAFCLPFQLTNAYLGEETCPFHGATIMSMPMDPSASNFDDGTLTLHFSKVIGHTTGNTAYLVKWEPAANIPDPVFKNVYLTYSKSSASVEAADAVFLGIAQPKFFEADDRTALLLNDGNQLYYPQVATTLNAFSGYFRLNNAIPAGMPTGVTDYAVMAGEDVLMKGSLAVGTPTLTLADNADNSTAIAAANGKVYDVVLSGRTLYHDGRWNTLCLPFKLDSFSGTPLDGATVKTLESASFADGKLTLNFVSVTQTEAGKPYLVKWARGTDFSDPVFTNVTIVGETADITTEVVDFKGCFAPVALQANDKTILYLGGDNKLYFPAASCNVNAFRGYFKLNGITAGELTAGEANAIVLNFDDDATTGIDSPPF